MKRVGLIVLIAMVFSAGVLAAPIAVELPTSDLTTALDNFTSTSFNGLVRWDSAGTANYKLRIADGTSGSPGLVTGGSGITWRTDGPQSFTFSFDGTVATLSVVDGGTTYLINATPSAKQVDSLLIGIRSRVNADITLSDLKVDGVSLNIGTLSLGGVSTRSFLYVSNVFAPFTLTGLVEMNRRGGGSGADVPAFQIFAGTSPVPDAASVPEPATYALVGFALLLLAMVWKRKAPSPARTPGKGSLPRG